MNPSLHWAFAKEKGTSIGMKIVIYSYLLGGSILSRIFLFPVIFFYFLFNPSLRQNSREYLKRIRKKTEDLPKINLLLSFNHLWQFGSSLIDKFAVWRGDIKLNQINIHGSECIHELLTNKKGGIIAITHLGNFEVCSALSQSIKGLRLNILQHTKHAKKFNSLLNKRKTKSIVEVLEVTDIGPLTAMKLSEKIERGEFIAIAADRLPINNPKASITCNFFDQPADFPTGPYVLAYVLRVPLLLMICVKREKKYHIYFEKIIDGSKISRNERIDFTTKAVKIFAKKLEHYTQQNPLQWFNFYRFWKKDL